MTQHVLSSKFDFERWKDLLGMMFLKIDYLTKPIQIEAALVKSGGQVGMIRLDDGRSLGLFKFEVADNIKIARNRKGLRDIAIKYVDQDITHGALVFYYSEDQADYRLTFVSKQTSLNEDGEFVTKATAPKRYTFLLGENEPCTTASIRLLELINKKKNGSVYLADVTEAFSVERLNKDFFKGYKEQYFKFLDLIGKDSKENRDYVKKLLGRLVFLQFLQKKGWMGVPASNTNWEGGDKNYLNNLIENYKGNNRLLSDVLEVLFFNTLNEKRDNDLADKILGENIKIPYLNGGLFDKDSLDKLDIDFPYDYFKELMEFFAMYNFTIDENDPDDAEVGVDPEMLGHIFENLLEDNKDKGAFYTPKEIVQYMSQESIAQYLKTHTEEALHSAIEELIKQKKVNEALQDKAAASAVYKLLCDVKVCDPAIGSGAFPMGVLNVLYHARLLLYGFTKPTQEFSPANVKREIIQNNIYGVDIEKGAVDIARLRFWLALVVDETQPHTLPNLDYKIMCGNSLIHRFALDTPFHDVLKHYNKENKTKLTLDDYRQWVYEYTDIADHTQKDIFRQRIEEIKNAFKTELTDKEKGKLSKTRGTIENLQAKDIFGNQIGKAAEIKELKKQLKELEQQRDNIESNKIYENAFEWRFEFPALLDEDGNFTGFDIVIGNPPYVNVSNIKPDNYRKKLQSLFYSSRNKSDLYSFFIEKGFSLLNTDGILCYIVPHTWKATDSFKNLREIIFEKHSLTQIVNQKMGVFDAVVNPMIILLKNRYQDNYKIDVFDGIGNFKYKINVNEIKADPNWAVDSESSLEEKLLFKTIEKSKYRLSDVIEFSRGIKTSNDTRFISNTCVNEDYKKVYRGRNIKAYSMNWDNEYIWYRPDLMKEKVGCLPHTKEFFEVPEKLITQRVNSSMQLLVAYDDQQNYFLDTTNVSNYKTWNKSFSLKFICGILNSKVVNYWYPHKYKMPTIGGYELSSIPIPEASKEQQQVIINLVNKIIAVKKEDAKADTSAWEKEIDMLVYELYGLTEEEVKVVEGK